MDLCEHLKALELDLLSYSTRKNAERILQLLAEDFREFGSSGRVYSRQDIVTALQEESPATLSLVEFELRQLAPDVAQVTYRSIREEPGGELSSALRSSLWVREGEEWRMSFHQGTRLPEVQ